MNLYYLCKLKKITILLNGLQIQIYLYFNTDFQHVFAETAC